MYLWVLILWPHVQFNYIFTHLVKLYYFQSTSWRYLLHFTAKIIFASILRQKSYICHYLPLEPYLPCREIPVNSTGKYRGGIFRPTLVLGLLFFEGGYILLYCGTPTFWQRGLWDSCFQNPSESSEITGWICVVCLA